ncbi:hypothetical protein JI75_04040 [Berryella intestinalis]|uniref:YdbS-like PH domain-containing protein n=1 Tax=Berryella intestinalis TaxID=1531429 RepID=A0A0A8B9Z2_9ACTN|nr:PH domain-containing protein [Berryella intestinalis]AJC11962.1 hypothetical protein JI75_04040 [Berryella intestinalis]
MSEAPETPTHFATGEMFKVHHSYLWLRFLSIAFSLVVIAVTSLPGIVSALVSGGRSALRLSVSGPEIVAAIVVLAFALALAFVVNVMEYNRLRYGFDEGEFSLHSGIVTKKRVHVPYSKVQSVNHTASILQRVAGVCTLQIETAGGAANKGVKVPYICLADAERIREELFLRKARALGAVPSASGASNPVAAAPGAPGSPARPAAVQGAGAPNVLDQATSDVSDWRGAWGGGAVGLEPVTAEGSLSNKQLLLSVLASSEPQVLAVILCTVVGAGAVASWLVHPAFMLIAVGVSLLALFVWACMLVGFAARFAGFKMRRRGSRIEVEHGLLQRVFSSIEVERIQSVNIRQSFVRKCFGYCELSLGRIDSVDLEEGSKGVSAMSPGVLVVHPFLKLSDASVLLGRLLPEFEACVDRPVSRRVAPVALRRALIRDCIWKNAGFYFAVVAAVLAPLFGGAAAQLPLDVFEVAALRALEVACWFVVVLALVAIAIAAVNAVVWTKESGVDFGSGRIAILSGGLRSSLTVCPKPKVQDLRLESNPFQRAAGVVSVVATTAAGVGRTSVRLRDLSEEDGFAVLSWFAGRVKPN